MRRSLFVMWLVVVVCTLIARPTRAADPKPPVDAHVIVVTIDGFAAYLLDDPQSPIPTIRKLAAEGATAEGLRPVNPSVTWPNHTTLITGVRPQTHGVLYNGVLSRSPDAGRPVRLDPARTQAELVAVPTIYEQLKPLGFGTAAINWPCTRGSQTIDDNFPDVPDQVVHMTPRLRAELVAQGALRDDTQKLFSAMSSPQCDAAWSAAACQVIRARKPNFMTYHILNTDGIHHKYGPQTPAGYTALALADQNIRDLMAAIDDAGIRDRTTLMIVADHGFNTARKLVLPNVMFRRAGLLTLSPTTAVLKARVQAYSEGGIAMVYLNDPATRDADRQATLELMKNAEGIDSILEPRDYAALGLPTPEQNPQSPDLILVAAKFHAFSNVAHGDEAVVKTDTLKWTIGNHGYLNTDPNMNAVFVAWGRGIRKGAKLGVIENIDVAPTAAHLLGVELKGATGKVLKDLLVEDPGK